jgi:hypothetical protein
MIVIDWPVEPKRNEALKRKRVVCIVPVLKLYF